METVLLSLIAALGLCAVSAHGKHQYHFVYDRKNMTEALSYCRDKHTDLATVGNMEDVRILRNMADLSKMVYPEYSFRAWIGLYDDVHSWRWSLSDRSFYEHGETEFRNWLNPEPNNKQSGELCTWMNDHGRWNDVPCDRLYKPVCCDVRGSEVSFVLISSSMTWSAAQSYCRTHHTDLASVRNMRENQRVQLLVPAGESVWIGLFRDSWKWSNGSKLSFTYWNQATREPNNNHGREACVAADFSHSGKWEDWNCDWKRAFICYSVPPVSKRVVKVSLVKRNQSLDLNDPVILEETLKQLKQKLKDQGVSEDVKLSWRRQSDGKVFHKDEEETKKRKRRNTKKEL